MMKQLDFKCSEKLDGLEHFKQRGWVLVDATYEPVDGSSDSVRAAIIRRDYEQLCCDLRGLTPDRSAHLVLVKTNVCQILEPMLRDEFKVLNRGTVIPFPSNGWQTPRSDGRKSFYEQFAAVVPRKLYGTIRPE